MKHLHICKTSKCFTHVSWHPWFRFCFVFYAGSRPCRWSLLQLQQQHWPTEKRGLINCASFTKLDMNGFVRKAFIGALTQVKGFVIEKLKKKKTQLRFQWVEMVRYRNNADLTDTQDNKLSSSGSSFSLRRLLGSSSDCNLTVIYIWHRTNKNADHAHFEC